MTMMHETQYVGNIKDEQEHIACVRREGVHQLLCSARISRGVSPQSQLISLYIGNGLPIEQMCSPTQLIRLLGQAAGRQALLTGREMCVLTGGLVMVQS